MKYKQRLIGLIIIGLLLLFLYLYKKTYYSNESANLPTIYVITATYARFVQKAELTRLCITLLHVKKVHWIVIEDAEEKTDLVKHFLKYDCSLIKFTHLFSPTPPHHKIKKNDPFWSKPKGVSQRNAAFEWLIEKSKKGHLPPGVVYIADDDNTYSLRVFDEMRHTKTISTWLVALSGELPYEGCTAVNGKITGFVTGYKPERPFPVDMAGFAVNLKLLVSHPDARFDYHVPIGYQESTFFQKLGVNISSLEPKGNDCQKILVWHTRTAEPLMGIYHRLRNRGITLPPIDDFI